MSKKKIKDKKSKPLPKPNRQIPNSMIRPVTAIGVNSVIQRAREFPFYGCWIMNGWQEAGLTPVVVARQQDDGRIMFGVYLIDLFCLGIKDAFTRADFSVNHFERELAEHLGGQPEKCSVELAHEVIYGALEYAEKLGFQPHPDFKNQMADLILDPPDAHPRDNHVEFGKNGRPLFIAGPYDDQFKIRMVESTLNRSCGEGNYELLMMG